MFKPRWRNQKKIKAVFKLQFQVTQVPQSGRNTLVISLVPEDVGKPTVRLQKAAVQNGTCSWENPIFETVKFIKDIKTGNVQEKIYHFLVSTASLKAGFSGEASVNFADYAEATQPFTASLPLEKSSSDAILHVTIERIQKSLDERDVQNSDNVLIHPEQGNGQPYDTVEGTLSAITSEDDEQQISTEEWSFGSALDESLIESAKCKEYCRERLQEVPDSSMEQLRNENSMLVRQAELTELELQSLRKQIVKERKRGENLSRQISSLKQKKDALMAESEQSASSEKCENEIELLHGSQHESKTSRIASEFSRELDHEKDLNANLHLELHRAEELNLKLTVEVRDLKEMLKQEEMEACSKDDKGDRRRIPEYEYKNNGQQAPVILSDAQKVDLYKKSADMYHKLEIYHKDNDELQRHVQQLDLKIGVLTQENCILSSTLEQNELQQKKFQQELSSSLIRIEELQWQVDRSEKERKELLEQLHRKEEQIDHMLLELDDRSRQLECAKMNEDQKDRAYSTKIESLAADIEKLRQENYYLSNLAAQKEKLYHEAEQMKTLFSETEMLEQRWDAERYDLEMKLASVNKELDDSQEELTTLRFLKVEKENMAEDMLCQVQVLRTQCHESRHEIDKEGHKKNELQSESQIHKEEGNLCIFRKLERNGEEIRHRLSKHLEDTALLSDLEQPQEQTKLREAAENSKISSIEKRELGDESIAVNSNMEQTNRHRRFYESQLHTEIQKAGQLADETRKLEEGRDKTETPSVPHSISNVNNGFVIKQVRSELEASTDEDCRSSKGYSAESLTEVKLLRERNKAMECDLKEMQERYSEISLKFAEVEGERQQLVIIIRNLKNASKN